jgi:hypothetical protein
VTSVWNDTQVGISQGVQVVLSGGAVSQTQTVDNLTDDGTGTNTRKGTVTFKGLAANTPYTITATAREVAHLGTAWNFTTIWGVDAASLAEGIQNGSMAQTVTSPQVITTNPAGQTTPASAGTVSSATPDSFMPLCGLDDTGPLSWVAKGSVFGCAEQFMYYVLFVPTSFIFALSGEFFDTTFAFSVNDASYRSTFVVQGWGIVRDFCNMFFIFVLLYIAFATILNLHGFKTKEMIINVVIIGLLMNFSLFAAQVIIDTSNILARVFYNSDTIKITAGPNAANGVTNATGGAVNPDGSLPLSAAIVNKVNPQNLIINGRQAVQLTDTVSGQSSIATNTAVTSDSGLGVGALILITILAIAINVIGIFVFVSVGLVFVARVIGLWLAMILVPLAFFSYTVPAMQDIDMIGWKKWWPDTLKLAFVAPVFIFFIYLILEFLNSGLGIAQVPNATGAAFVLGIMVPFIFIMILLLKAKDIAKKMSGTLGESITGGISAAAALALGGAALGTAALGRNVVGKSVAAMSRTEGNQKMVKYRQELRDFKSGKRTEAPIKPDVKLNAFERFGDKLNQKQEKVNEVDHARHEIDSLKEKNNLKGVDDSNLSGVDNQKLKTTYIKEKKSEAESELRKSMRVENEDGIVSVGEDGYKSANRKKLVDAMREDPDNILPDKDKDGKVILDADGKPTGQLTDEAKKKIENELNVNFNALLKTGTDQKLDHDYEHLKSESKQKVSGFERVFSQANKGSYDVRNLSQTKTDKREHITTRASAGLIAGIAMGIRTGLKSHNINHGSGQADFLKDIGHTITEAMKSTKINVKVEESHGKSVGDAKGGGGHH